MGNRKRGSPPAYLLHRATGQAYATLNGKRHYFGRHGTAESRRRYADFIRSWEKSHGETVVVRAAAGDTLSDLVPQYTDQLRGKVSPRERAAIIRNLGTLTAKFGDYRPDEFRTAELEALVSEWDDHYRSTIRKATGRVLRFVRWLVAQELCRYETFAILMAAKADALRGRGKVGDPVVPVPLRDLVLTLRECSRQVRAICLVTYYAGARPGEACRMTGAELFRAGSIKEDGRAIAVPPGVWLFRPSQQKTKKKAVYVIGPRLQAVLTPLLRRDPAEPMFSPADARRERHEHLRRKRKSPVQPSQVDRSKRNPKLVPGEFYEVEALDKRIKVAAKRGGAGHWSANQLRHNYVSRMDHYVGLATASEAVGHAGMPTTLIYLERKIRDVANAARRVG